MAAVLIDTDDFIGKYAINTGTYGVAMVQDIIDSTETEIMNNLLGTTYATAFIADAAGNGGVPADADNLAIYNPIQLDSVYVENYSSGIKEMLKAIVFQRWNVEVSQSKTNTGIKKNQTTNSSSQNVNSVYLAKKYNLAIANYKVIQHYIKDNLTDYPTWDGVDKNFMQPF